MGLDVVAFVTSRGAVEQLAAEIDAGTRDHKCGSLIEPEALVAIKPALIALRRDFRGVFNVATTNEPAKLIRTNALPPQFADRDRKLPGVSTNVFGKSPGL
jgi:hypothetical protein